MHVTKAHKDVRSPRLVPWYSVVQATSRVWQLEAAAETHAAEKEATHAAARKKSVLGSLQRGATLANKSKLLKDLETSTILAEGDVRRRRSTRPPTATHLSALALSLPLHPRASPLLSIPQSRDVRRLATPSDLDPGLLLHLHSPPTHLSSPLFRFPFASQHYFA